MEDKCECPMAGFCERHQVQKTAHLHKLCQHNEKYFKMWEECRGPGQQGSNCGKSAIKITRGEQAGAATEEKDKLPSLFTQAKNLAAATTSHVLNGMRSVAPDEKQRRLEICRSCPHFIAESMRCGNCGCYLETKASWQSSKCPIAKW